jgi:P4 family phage/plasmid primase-like protien
MNVVNEEHLTGLDHAQDLAARGWPVIPYLARADGAQLKDWPILATTDPEQIDAWFAPGQPYEGSYVATIPGLVGKTCTDFDAHPDKPNGFETAKRLGLPSTASVSFPSASGVGRHNWYDGATTSKAIYPGIDRKSKKGLVRVTYLLPNVEDVYESLPAEFRINDSPATGREFRGEIVDWISRHSGKLESGKVRAARDSIPEPFIGHSEMLRYQTRMVLLAGEGHGGVPESLAQDRERWISAPHKTSSLSPATDWDRALEGAIVASGGEPPKLNMESHPDEFFDKSRLKSKTLAEAICYDLAIGPDGSEWVYRDGVWRPEPGEVETRTVRILGDRYTRAHSSTMDKAVLKGIDLPQIKLDADYRHINMKNGMLDWQTLELKPHGPEFMSTVQLPFEYDPSAQCPNFEKWVDEVIPADCHQIFWEFLGYMMMSGNPLQIAILFYGDGGNGKTTGLRLLVRLLGVENISNVDLRSMSENKFAVAEMFGKIANIAGDIDAKYLSDTAQFKQITGEDTVRAEEKYKKAFSFTPWAVPVFSANKLWRSADDTEGYYRRWVIIPFPNKLDRSKSFDEGLLHAEVAGIANKALANLRALMERGRFAPNGAALEVMDEFRLQNDPVRMWLEDKTMVHTGVPNTRMKTTDTYQNYTMWCALNGYKAKGSKEFYSSLRREGFKVQASNGHRYFLEIVKTESVVPLPDGTVMVW